MPPAAETEKHTSVLHDFKTLFTSVQSSQAIPSEFVKRVKSLLAQFLGGVWNDVTVENLRIKKLSGGLTNLLLLAQLSHGKEPYGTEPHNALIRIYAETNPEQLLQESIIFNILSERKICPRLLGVFPGGRIERYIPSRTLYSHEFCQPEFARLIGKKLVDVHLLEMPLNKNPKLFDQVRPWLKKLKEVTKGTINIYPSQAKVDSNEYPAVVTIDDLFDELEFVENFMKKSGSPVVFCHNDIWVFPRSLFNSFHQEKNILLQDDANSADESLIFIDYEAAAYNYRGFDFGQYFCAAGMDFDTDEPYIFNMQKFDDVELRRILCNSYLDAVYETENNKLATGERTIDLKTLIEESFVFMPVANFFYGCWSLFYGLNGLLTQSDSKGFDYGAYGRDQLILYYQQKKYIEAFLNKKL